MNTSALTEERLRSWLDSNQAARERLCLALLGLLPRFSRVHPRRPKGGTDGGYDIAAVYDGNLIAYGAVGFRNSAKDDSSDKAWLRKKFKDDLNSALSVQPKPSVFVFFTNLDLTPTEVDKLVEYGLHQGLLAVEVCFRERMRILLDSAQGLAIRYQYLNIELSSAEQATFFTTFGDQLQQLVVSCFGSVEERLVSLQAGIGAIQSPLLPCGLLLTLRFEVSDTDLDRVFEGQEGYRALVSEPLPAFLHGTGPGRFHTPNGYMDFNTEAIHSAGICRHAIPNYNILHRSVSHTICLFQGREFISKQRENEPLFVVPHISIEIYFSGKPKLDDSPPDLILKSDAHTGSEVVWTGALDNTVCVDHVYQALSVSHSSARWHSSSEISGAYIRCHLDFFFIKDINTLAWPWEISLHNLQLWFGGNGQRLFRFTSNELAKQQISENPDSFVKGDALTHRISFECEITTSMFAQNYHSYS